VVQCTRLFLELWNQNATVGVKTILHEVQQAPITFLDVTESKLHSSMVSFWSEEAARFVFSTISAVWCQRGCDTVL
jgi:hypothetical protein